MTKFKGLLKSKIFWLNVASIGAEVTGAVAGVVPPGTALLVVNVLNIVLRTVTTQSLEEKGSK